MKNILLFFLGTSAVIATSVLLQPLPSGKLSGLILHQTTPVWVARIDLIDSNGITQLSTLSDHSGKFSFDSIPSSANYLLRVTHPSYSTCETEFSFQSIDPHLEIQLQPKPVVKEHENNVKKEAPGRSSLIPEESIGFASKAAPGVSRKYHSAPVSRGGTSDIPVGAGTLTAGEINDFSKWVLWEDLTETRFEEFQKKWGLFLKNRYTVQVKFKQGNPVVDAEVQLLGDRNERVFLARTDNTGKAELWADMIPQTRDRMLRHYKAVVKYKGKDYRFPVLNDFPNGINSLEIEMPCEVSPIMDIAFVVDGTGSMGDEIDYLKAELEDVIQRVGESNPHAQIRTGSVFYRDRGDQYLTRLSDFTPVLDTTLQFIQQQNAAGGGDFPEAVDEALDAALNRLSWSPEARGRLLFLVLDAPPHQADTIVSRVQQLMVKAAAMGVRIIPVTGSGINQDVEFLMRSMALATNGTYTFLTNHSGVGNSHLAPSTDDYTVQKLNDLLVNLINRYAQVNGCESIQSINDSSDQNNPHAHASDSLQLTCYPVPSVGPVNFLVSHPGGILHIFDSNGKLVLRFEMTERNLLHTDMSQFATGIYIVRYEHQGKAVSSRILIRPS
ncbi:MAG: T9SS type A sorting domain-containing protein [Bacteroidetes bacterium]|nr:T9SS type A sorting domain-containing protein [Bacteroidota bacterium]